jgi:hypothetical protein
MRRGEVDGGSGSRCRASEKHAIEECSRVVGGGCGGCSRSGGGSRAGTCVGRVARKIVGGAAESLLSAGWDLFSLTRRRSVVVVVVSGISARQRRWHSTASYKVE